MRKKNHSSKTITICTLSFFFPLERWPKFFFLVHFQLSFHVILILKDSLMSLMRTTRF